MAAPKKGSGDGLFLFSSIFFIMAIFVYFNFDKSRIFTVTTKLVLLLGFLTFLVHLFKKIKPKLMPVPDIKSKYSKDELKSKQSDHWLMKQEETDTKAASFEERVSRPRRETHLKKNEEKYQQFSGPVWKGKGYKLEGKNTETVTKRRGKGSSKDAIAMRNLPDSAYPPPMELNEDAAKNKPVVKEKKMIKLPVEPPPESDLQAVTIALRVPFGEKRRRRFLTSATIQVIFDWLTVEGYNSDIYTIKTTYPSKDLSDSKNKTLEELGLSKDVILIVDDKDV